MKKNRKLIKQATNLSSSELQRLLSDSNLKNYQIEFLHATELPSEYQQQIIDLFETNMKTFYEQSHDGYQPDDKRNELFSNQSRYLLIRSTDCLVAFTHFRFDMDYGSRVIYLYELQVNSNYQGQGLGRWIIDQLKILCQKTEMSKIVLTVHQSNTKAIDFYMKKCQFKIDITNPDDEPVDYLILSYSI